MFTEQENVIRYKWDPSTGSGYRLRYEPAGCGNSYHVEDWNNHVVVEEVGCADIDEALDVLNRFFDIDVAQERSRIAGRLPQRMQ